MSDRLAVEQAALGDLKPFPGNARRGDVDSIAESLRVNGQFRPLVVQRSTGYVLAGNHTLQAAQKLGWPSIQVTYLDVDDEAARRIVIADNRTADLGTYDDRALITLLRELGEDLSGTGYDLDDFDDLLASIEEADADNPPQEPTALLPVTGAAGSAYGEGGSAEGTNVRQTPSYREYEDAYATRATRFIALIYPLAQYAWVVQHLGAIAAEEGVASNSEALLRLIEARTGATAPAEDASISDEAVAAAERAAVTPAAEEPAPA